MKTKMRNLWRPQRVLAFLLLAGLCLVSITSPLIAQTVTTGYSSDSQLQRGMIVQLVKNNTKKIEPVKMETADQMHGVVVNANDAPVTLSSEGQKVFIATTGHFDVLVSTQNGTIEPGDYLSVSALPGIGMRAGTKEPVIVGRALKKFDGKDPIGTTKIKDNGGVERTVSIGRVEADISVSRNPNLKAENPNLPSFLKKAAEGIAGKAVPTWRIYLSSGVFVVCTFVAAILMYGGIRSGIISIGRNPLSKKSIIRGMLQVIVTGMIIFITGIFAVYLLLKL